MILYKEHYNKSQTFWILVLLLLLIRCRTLRNLFNFSELVFSCLKKKRLGYVIFKNSFQI